MRRDLAEGAAGCPIDRKAAGSTPDPFEVNKKRDRVFVEIGYEKRNEARVQISRFYKGPRKDFFKDLGEENG